MLVFSPLREALLSECDTSWLNEGWTMYLERRIGAAIHGDAHFDFSAVRGWKSLGNA